MNFYSSSVPGNEGSSNRWSYIWAVTLSGLGMLLLAQVLGRGLPVWQYVVRGWPLLLIGLPFRGVERASNARWTSENGSQ